MQSTVPAKSGYDEGIELVGQNAFDDVVPRFQNLGRRASFNGLFYDFTAGQNLVITDDLLALSSTNRIELEAELDARWGLLEGAFKIGADNFHLKHNMSHDISSAQQIMLVALDGLLRVHQLVIRNGNGHAD